MACSFVKWHQVSLNAQLHRLSAEMAVIVPGDTANSVQRAADAFAALIFD